MSGAVSTHNALMAELAASAAPVAEADFERVACDATEDLLLVMEPLIELARGPKRERIKAAFLRVAAANMRRRTRNFATPLPSSPRGVALALHRAVLELCQAHGLGAMDLMEAYQDQLDDPASLRNERGPSLDRVKALTALLIAHEHVVR